MTMNARELAEKIAGTEVLTVKSQTFFRRFGWSYNKIRYGTGGNFPNMISRTLSFHVLASERK